MKTVINIHTFCSLKLRGISLAAAGLLLFTLDEKSSQLCAIMFGCFSLFAGVAGLYLVWFEKKIFVQKRLLLLESILSVVLALKIAHLYYFSVQPLQDFLNAIAFFSGIMSLLFLISLFLIVSVKLKAICSIITLYSLHCVLYAIVPIIIFNHTKCHLPFCEIKCIGIPLILQGVLLLILKNRFYFIRAQKYILSEIKYTSSNNFKVTFGLIKIPQHCNYLRYKIYKYLLN